MTERKQADIGAYITSATPTVPDCGICHRALHKETLPVQLRCCKNSFCFPCLKSWALGQIGTPQQRASAASSPRDITCPFCRAIVPRDFIARCSNRHLAIRVREVESLLPQGEPAWAYATRKHPGVWWLFDDVAARTIEKAYREYLMLQGNEIVSIEPLPTRTFEVNFKTMEQHQPGFPTRKMKRFKDHVDIPSQVCGIAGVSFHGYPKTEGSESDTE